MSLFSGVGGIEVGLNRARSFETTHMCDSWAPSQDVLSTRFPDTEIISDVLAIDSLANFDVVTAGFPCTDLSQAGRTEGIDGAQSGLVRHVLKLVGADKPEWVLFENVPNMLRLQCGRAIDVIVTALEGAGYNWAYRTIDSRAFGIPHRRRRVFLLASREEDPARVLFRGGQHTEAIRKRTPTTCGFYWTEGNTGLGWAEDAVPTLKGSTTVSIPSPPAVWRRRARTGPRIVTPTIEVLEQLQGLPAGWTSAAPKRDRWKLVGNAVTVDVAEWIGRGMLRPAKQGDSFDTQHLTGPWPKAAMGSVAGRYRVDASEFPSSGSISDRSLHGMMQRHGFAPLSHRATAGFRNRLAVSRLRYDPIFMDDLNSHVALMAGR